MSAIMDTESVRIFAEVARQNSFSRAAKKLQLPTSNVSARVQKLEEELGVRLFDRNTRKVQLTQIGEMVFDRALDLLETVDGIHDLVSSLEDEPRGLLRICAMATMGTLFLGDLIIEFRQKYPHVTVELIYSNVALDLKEHRLDFAFRQNILADSSLVAKKLVEETWIVIASPAYLAASTPILKPEDLHDHSCIGYIGDSVDTAWRFLRGSEPYQLRPKTTLAFEDPHLCYKAAVAGIGVAYIPQFMAQANLQTGDIVELLSQWRVPPQDFYMVYNKKNPVPERNRVFMEFIQKKFSDIVR